MNELQQAITDGTVLMMEKVRGCESDKCVGYMVLRQRGSQESGYREWVSHYYNANQDAFEYGVYSTKYLEAVKKYKTRVKEYQEHYLMPQRTV